MTTGRSSAQVQQLDASPVRGAGGHTQEGEPTDKLTTLQKYLIHRTNETRTGWCSQTAAVTTLSLGCADVDVRLNILLVAD